jgi:hypothetical protein|tara:strand:+ start:250 stop:693 length:444 start_codon:yes stop_codon:yes gene_type:complete
MLLELNQHIVNEIIADDPVRPHISAEWRLNDHREVYGLYSDESFEELRSVICVAYTDEVPTCESDMNLLGSSVAVFYTVWSYDKGAGKDIVFAVAEHIQKNKLKVRKFVTLSPLTEMAKRFHLKNGAKFLNRHMHCQNFEYELDNWR